MARIVMRPRKGGGTELIVNDLDLSLEVYAESAELVVVGDDPEFAEIGLRFTIAIDRLELGDPEVMLTDGFAEAAEAVRALQEVDLADAR